MQTAPEQSFSTLPKIGQYSISKTRDTLRCQIFCYILEEIKNRFSLGKDQFSRTLFIKKSISKIP